jgi:hypothetical protein
MEFELVPPSLSSAHIKQPYRQRATLYTERRKTLRRKERSHYGCVSWGGGRGFETKIVEFFFIHVLNANISF